MTSGFPHRKSGVQKFKSRFELLGPMGLEILKRLGAGNTASDACKGLCCKSNVSYWKNRLLDIGALRLQTPGLIKYYTLTPYGSKLLARSEGGRLERVVLEDHAVKFLVVEGERRRLDWVKLGRPANWEMLGVRIGSVRVVRTSRSVIVYPGRLRGFDVDELLVMAGRTVEWVRSILEGRFGMVLGEMVPLHKPVFRFYSDEAKEDVKSGTCIVEGVGSVDNSPPERVPHEEYQGRDRARARLLLPDSVRRLELKVDGMVESVNRLVDTLGKLVVSAEVRPELLKGGSDYVS